MGRHWTLALVCAAAAAMGACASGRSEGAPAPAATSSAECCKDCPWTNVHEAIAVVHPTQGNMCRGWVRFTDVEGGVRVTAEFSGLSPNAKHAFHVHEFGDCSDAAKATSAGGHYNPGNHPHAGPDAEHRHAGDLGNVETDAAGKARYERVLAGISVASMHNPVIGRSVIIHAKEDDLVTQPTGNAGDRIGCGVIGVAKSAAAGK